MFAVRHRTASGRLDAMWEYDPTRRVIHLVFRLGAAEPHALIIPVCSPDSPRFGAWVVTRSNGETWKLHALRMWPVDGRSGDGPLMPSVTPIHPMLVYDTVYLTNTPENVDGEISLL